MCVEGGGTGGYLCELMRHGRVAAVELVQHGRDLFLGRAAVSWVDANAERIDPCCLDGQEGERMDSARSTRAKSRAALPCP